jgi:membrane protein YdbS with pleckstrin-like domain
MVADRMRDMNRETQATAEASAQSTPPRTSPRQRNIADGAWKRLHPHWIAVKRLGMLITLGILGTPALVGLLLVLFVFNMNWLMRWTIVAALVCFLAWRIWLVVWYPPMAYRHARYRVSPLGVEFRYGVFWRSIVNVPRSRVQHTDVDQGPLLRYYGLGMLVMHTAGTHNAEVGLPGIRHETAMRIRDFLIQERES